MKIVVCGAGRITDELLKRLSEKWEITLLDTREEKIHSFPGRFPNVTRIMAGDASSPLILEKAGVEENDTVMALTRDDEVNFQVASHARDKKVKNIMALVSDPENLPRFKAMNVWCVSPTTSVARQMDQYLRNPGISVVPLSGGDAEILEMTVGRAHMSLQKELMHEDPDWKVVGLIRDHDMLFTDENNIRFQEGDRLLVLGGNDLFRKFSGFVEKGQSHFPFTYGQTLAVGLFSDDQMDKSDILKEAVYIFQDTQLNRMDFLCQKEVCGLEEQIKSLSESLDTRFRQLGDSMEKSLAEFSRKHDYGLVMIPPIKSSFFQVLTRPTLKNLAQQLTCPLMVARNSAPYDRIIVPFNGTDLAKTALHIGMDLSRQMSAPVVAIVVEEPDFLHGDQSGDDDWKGRTLETIRDLARENKARVKEMVKSGNPVREILSVCEPNDLMIVACSTKNKDLFSFNVAEHLVKKACCSVIMVAR